MRVIRIGTRESRLAMIQAEMVAGAIRARDAGIEVRLVPMKTTGDRILDRTLDKVGGKGLFVRELDEALRQSEVDICVHSYKDLPGETDPALPVVAVSPREDPRDALVLPLGAGELGPGPAGCSSRRRAVQLAELLPGRPVQPVRGNVLTRLEKLDRGEYAALILACAGLIRLGLRERASRVFSPDEMLPAGCQGVLAVQGRAGEDHSYLAGLHDPVTWDIALAERAFIRRLGSGCGAPVGAYGELWGEKIRLRGMIADEAGIHRDEITGERCRAEELGRSLAEKLLEGRGTP